MSPKRIEIYRTFSSEKTKELGCDVARSLVSGENGATVFALQGDLGAGKTTFVQGFLKGLGSKKRATSPTFVLMRRHRIGGATAAQKKFKNVFHIDAYRLKNPEHLASLELDVILNQPGDIILIEWPEQAKKFLPKNTTWIKFNYGKKENERTIAITRPKRMAAKVRRRK